MSARVELWTNWACAGGTRVGALTLVSGSLSLDVGGDDRCRVRVREDARTPVALRQVLRITTPDGVVREFRVQSRSRRLGDGTRELGGVSPAVDLSTSGLVRRLEGGIWRYAIAGTRTPAAWLSDVVLANAAADGLAWVSVGTVTPTAAVPLEAPAAGWTRAEWWRRLADITGAERVFRRNGDAGYVLELVSQVGAGASVVRARFGRNLLDLTDGDDDADACSAITVQGATADGVVAGIAENAWLLGAIPGAAPFWVPLTDPDGGAAPVAFDGQVDGFALLTRGGTTVPVLESRASDSAVRVGATAGLVAGELVQLLAAADGTRAHELQRPNAPRLHRTDTLPVRGERNLVRNGTVQAWTGLATLDRWTIGTQAWAAPFRRDGVTTLPAAVTTPTAGGIAVTGGPPGFRFYRGENLQRNGFQLTVTNTVDLDGAGAGTVLVSGTVSAGSFPVALHPTLNQRVLTLPDDGVATTQLAALANMLGATLTRAWPPALGDIATHGIVSEGLTVQRVAGLPWLHVAAGVSWTAAGPSSSTWPRNTDSGGTWTDDPTNITQRGLPALSLRVGGAWAAHDIATGNPSAPITRHVTLRAAHALPANATADVVLWPSSGLALSHTLFRWVTLWLAPLEDASVPPPIGDAPLGNLHWHRGNRALQARALSVRQLKVTMRDLSRAAGYSVTREQITLGGTVALEDIGATVRVVGVSFDVYDPGAVELTLDSRPRRLVELLAERNG